MYVSMPFQIGTMLQKQEFCTQNMTVADYSPALKKWGYTGFTMSFRRSVLPSFRYSVIPLFRPNFISTQYLENELTESDQILYVH